MSNRPEPPGVADLCGLADAAALLRVDYTTLLRWVQRQLVPSRRLGGQYLLERHTLLAPFSQLPPLPDQS